MLRYKESPDQMYSGWHEEPTKDGMILVKLKKSGVLGAHEIRVFDWDYAKCQKLINDFVATGQYPVD